MTKFISELFHTVAILVLKKTTESYLYHTHAHTHKKKQFKNETHINIISLWPFMNVYTLVSWGESVE